MTAKDVIMLNSLPEGLTPLRSVDPETPLLEVLPKLLDAPGRVLSVAREDDFLGIINQVSMLEGLGRLIAERDDSSILTVECPAEQYSASALAHAVEDADAHLVDLISRPAENGNVRVMLRVRSEDPGPAASSLERYGYSVIERSEGESGVSDILAERLANLQALINV